MQCCVCERALGAKRKAVCPSCARAALYKSRLEQAAALLDREKWQMHAEAVTRPGNDGVLAALPEDADWDAIAAGIKTHSVDRMNVEMTLAEERIRGISASAEQLRQQIEFYKTSIEKRKGSNERRKKDLSTEKVQLEKRRGRTIESVQASLSRGHHRIEKTQKKITDAREYLCRVVGLLSGLEKRKGEDGKATYYLSGLPLPDLRDLNAMNEKIKVEAVETTNSTKSLAEPHEVISASFDNISRLIGIACHYLSIRVPAEIILPHNHFPHAAVLPRDSSYRANSFRYPGPLSTQSSSPVASRILQRSDLSKPRLLRLDRPLPQMRKEEPKAAGLFLDAVALLSYDIAWLCHSQGIDIGSSFGDICAVGRNLHSLVYRKDGKSWSRPMLNRNLSSATTKTEHSITPTSDPVPTFGTFSHGNAHHSLAGYKGFVLFSLDSWPVREARLVDALKSYLRQETARAEWHIIEDTEWDEERDDERAVLVGGTQRALDPKEVAMSVLSVKPSDGTDEAELPVRERGNRGWTKVRGRDGDD